VDLRPLLARRSRYASVVLAEGVDGTVGFPLLQGAALMLEDRWVAASKVLVFLVIADLRRLSSDKILLLGLKTDVPITTQPLLRMMNLPPTAAQSDKEIFWFASKLKDGAERENFLDAVLVQDTDRRQHLQVLLEKFAGDAPNILDEVVSQVSPMTNSAKSFLEYFEDMTAAQRTELSWDPRGWCGKTIGPYVLEEFLGSGGMGVVYRASQTVPISRTVAMKIVRPDYLSDKTQAALEQERKMLERIAHPGIVQVLDAGVTRDGIDYFVMEYVAGETITAYSQTHRLNPSERLALMIDVCRAVHHAHQRGIIHQDLKPANLLVCEQGDERVVKVIDFGISRAQGSDRPVATSPFTLRRSLFGTPKYMSPEQTRLLDEEVDTRSDIYALGIVLYELLCETHPYEGLLESSAALHSPLECIRSFVPKPPSQQVPAHHSSLRKVLARDLDWVILRAIAKDPEHRYASANALAEDLQRFLDGLPVDAHPPSLAYRAGKFSARHRTTLTMLTAVFVAIIATTIISIRQAAVATAARKESEQLLFVADMKIASDALREGRVALARERLLRHAQAERTIEEHSFPWRYLWQQLNAESRIFRENNDLFSMAVSPDNRCVVSGDKEGRLHVRELESGKKLAELAAHRQSIRALAFSPDGRMLASGSDDGHIKIYLHPSMRLAYEVTVNPTGVNDLEWLDGHSLLVAAGNELSLAKLPAQLPEEVPSVDSPPVVTLASAPPASESHQATTIPTVASATHSTAVSQTIVASFPQTVYDIAISPDRRTLATASQSDNVLNHGWVSLWDSQTFELLKRNSTASKAISICFSPDGQTIVSGSQFGFLDVFSRDDLQSVARQVPAHSGNIYRLTFTPDGKALASASKDSTLRLWDTSNWSQLRLFQSHQRRVYGVAVSPLTDKMYSCSADGTIREYGLHRSHYRNVSSAQAANQAGLVRSNSEPPHATFIPYHAVLDPRRSELYLSYQGTRTWRHRLADNDLAPIPFVGPNIVAFLGEDRLVLASPTSIYRLDEKNQLSQFTSREQAADYDADGRLDRLFGCEGSEGFVWQSGNSAQLPTYTQFKEFSHVRLQAVFPPWTAGHSDYLAFFEAVGEVVYVSLAADGSYRQQALASLPALTSVWRWIQTQEDHRALLSFNATNHTLTLQKIEFAEDFTLRQPPIVLPVEPQDFCDLTAIDRDADGELDTIFAASKAGKVLVFATEAGDKFELLQQVEIPHPILALNVHREPTAGSIAWELDVGGPEAITRFQLASYGKPMGEGRVVPSIEQAVSGSSRLISNVLIVDRESYAVQAHWNSLDFNTALAASPDGRWIATSGNSRRIHLWDRQGNWVGVFEGTTTSVVYEMQFTRDGSKLCVADGDNAKVYDVHQRSLLHTLQGHQNTIQTMAISPSSRWLATASHDHTIRLWDLETGTSLKVFIGHSALPDTVAFDLQAKMLVSGDKQGKVIFWDIATGGELLQLQNPEGNVHRLFVESSERLLTMADDGSVLPFHGYSLGRWSVEENDR
jgi:WD40 repeat protein/serine/threonine protein kinase